MTYLAHLVIVHEMVDGVPEFRGVEITDSPNPTVFGGRFHSELLRVVSDQSPAEASKGALRAAARYHPWTVPYLEENKRQPQGGVPAVTKTWDDIQELLTRTLGRAPDTTGKDSKGCPFGTWGKAWGRGPGVDLYCRQGTRAPPCVRVDLYAPDGGAVLVIAEHCDSLRDPAVNSLEEFREYRQRMVKTWPVRVPLEVAAILAAETLSP